VPVEIASGYQFNNPTGLAVSVDGTIWVADGKLVLVAPGGTVSAIDPHVDAQDVWVDPLGQAWIATPKGVFLRTVDGGVQPVKGATDNTVGITGDALGNLWISTRAPGQSYIKRIAPDGSVSIKVGTGQDGYNGNQQFGILLAGNQVQVNQPGGLSVGLDGIVYFADTANNLLRGYAPSHDHVVELGGQIGDDGPVGGFNSDGCWAPDTQFSAPNDIAVTRLGTFVVADTGNRRLRQFGHAPPETDATSPLTTPECNPSERNRG
jgi:hypothetical protein